MIKCRVRVMIRCRVRVMIRCRVRVRMFQLPDHVRVEPCRECSVQ